MACILVVDDDEMVRSMLRITLADAGYEVIEAENGKKALLTLQDNCADCAIIDIFMPEMDGIETIRHLRRRDSGLKIIAISGGGQKNELNYLGVAEFLGADYTFTKPLDNEKLLTALRECFSESI